MKEHIDAGALNLVYVESMASGINMKGTASIDRHFDHMSMDSELDRIARLYSNFGNQTTLKSTDIHSRSTNEIRKNSLKATTWTWIVVRELWFLYFLDEAELELVDHVASCM